VNLDTSRAEFVDHATGTANDDGDGGDERPAVVRVGATLDVETEPLAAYAALSGYPGESGESDGSDGADETNKADDIGRTNASGEDERYSFLLESAEKVASSDPAGAFAPAESAETDHARYSFVGYDPAAVVTIDDGQIDTEVFDGRYAGLVELGRASHGADNKETGGDRSPSDGTTEHAGAPDTLDHLREVLSGVRLAGFPETDRQLLDGGLVGFLAYDAVYDLHLREVGLERPPSSVPDAQFVLTTKTVVFDHTPELGAESDTQGEDRSASGGRTGPVVSLMFTPVVRPDDDPGAIYDALRAEAERVEQVLSAAGPIETGGFRRTSEHAGSRAEYEAAVARANEHVLDGDIYQGVLSRAREYDGRVDPLGLYEALRAVNPSPYMYLLENGDGSVVGASPETLLSVSGTEIVSNPIAGTCSRGASPVEDRRLAGEMLADGKERSEHTMLVDLARNDVRRVARSGSVRVPEFMNVLKYSHVQHIESTVTGDLHENRDAFDAVRAAFPAGTLSGAPKIRAMEIIDALETEPRGLYGGGVGYFSWTGDADLAIVIRTAAIEHGVAGDAADIDATETTEATDGNDGDGRARDRITVQAGAGIVADSDPASEYDETERKMNGVLVALRRIERSKAPAEATR
jgi:anthranilate synthase component 1